MNLIDLVVPGLCGPLPDTDFLKVNPTLSSLARLLARADRFQSARKGFHPELAALFGLHAESSMPSAALSLLGENRELGEGHWFHADPVHLQADMDHAILRDSSSLDLSREESDALINEVNRHFSDDGIRLIAIDANHWFINIADILIKQNKQFGSSQLVFDNIEKLHRYAAMLACLHEIRFYAFSSAHEHSK